MDIVFGLLLGSFVFLFTILAATVGLYIIGALAYVRLLTLCNYENPNMGWIPFVGWYDLMEIVVPEDVGDVRLCYKLAPCFGFLSGVPFIGLLCAIILQVYFYGMGIAYLESTIKGYDINSIKVKCFILAFFKPIWLIYVLATY